MGRDNEDKLKTYRQERDFGRTPEPEQGRKAISERPTFVIQKHDAGSLHYDFCARGHD